MPHKSRSREENDDMLDNPRNDGCCGPSRTLRAL